MKKFCLISGFTLAYSPYENILCAMYFGNCSPKLLGLERYDSWVLLPFLKVFHFFSWWKSCVFKIQWQQSHCHSLIHLILFSISYVPGMFLRMNRWKMKQWIRWSPYLFVAYILVEGDVQFIVYSIEIYPLVSNGDNVWRKNNFVGPFLKYILLLYFPREWLLLSKKMRFLSKNTILSILQLYRILHMSADWNTGGKEHSSFFRYYRNFLVELLTSVVILDG